MRQVVNGARIGLAVRPETLLGQDTEFGQASAAVVAAIMALKRTVQQRSTLDPNVKREIKVSRASANAGGARPIDWRPSYSVGVVELDQHHQHFFHLINLLQQGITECKEDSVVDMILGELSDYAQYHFSREEELMEKAHYAGLVDHRREHTIFVSRLSSLMNGVEAPAGASAFCVLDFVRSWLVKHIQQVDKKYSTDLKTIF